MAVDDPTAQLSVPRPSEMQIRMLVLSATGMTHADVGREVFLSRWTVKEYLDGMREMIGAKNLTHAVAICICEGFLTPEDLQAACIGEQPDVLVAA